MKLLDSIFEFKGNIPSICDIRLGENYHKLYDLVSSVQEKKTGDFYIDHLLDEYGVFVDVDVNENDNISKIIVTFFPYTPFGYSDMKNVILFFTKSFGFTSKVEHIEEKFIEYELEYNYLLELSNDSYQIEVKKTSDNPQLLINLTSPLDDVGKLQGSNIYYYHEPLGLFAVRDSMLNLSLVKHNGVLSREDVVDNLIAAMKRSNENGEDWHFDYAHSFLHQVGMIKSLDDPNLLEDEDYIRAHAEEMTDVYDFHGSQAKVILSLAGVGEKLVPIEEYFKEELFLGEINDLGEYIEDLSSEWSLSQVLPYESLDY